MSYPTRSIPSHIRQPSMAPPSSSTGQSPALIARVNEKKAELESLKELRDLSAAVASQMEALEQKLSTLSDGTEGMAFHATLQRTSKVMRILISTEHSYCTCHGQLAQCTARHQYGFIQVTQATNRRREVASTASNPRQDSNRACTSSAGPYRCSRGRMNSHGKRSLESQRGEHSRGIQLHTKGRDIAVDPSKTWRNSWHSKTYATFVHQNRRMERPLIAWLYRQSSHTRALDAPSPIALYVALPR